MQLSKKPHRLPEMDTERCSFDDSVIISSPDEKRVKLSDCSDQSESKSPTAENDFTNDCFDSLNSENATTKQSSNKKGINLLSDADDSFDVFLPLKKTSSQSSNESKKQTKTKQKKKLISRTRSCQYFSTKNTKDYFKSPAKSQEDKDLELAIKLSLKEVAGSSSECQVQASAPAPSLNRDAKIENPLKLQNWKSKKDSKKNAKTLLTRRTAHDRQQIITQKVAIVLLETKENQEPNSEKSFELYSSVLEELLDKNSTLWELSKIDAELDKFYVKSLSNFIEPVVLTSRVSDMPLEVDEVLQPADCSPVVKIKDELISNNSADEILSNFTYEEKLHSKLESLKLLSNDWGKLLGKEEHCDLRIISSTGILPCHKLVLLVRCPSMLDEVMEDPPDTIDFSTYSFACVKIFLVYIYSGKTLGIPFLSNDQTKDLLALANKFNLTDLRDSLVSSGPCDDSIYTRSTVGAPQTPPLSELLSNQPRSGKSAICLSDSSSDSAATKYCDSGSPLHVPNPKIKLESHSSFDFLSNGTESPDLFECNAQADISLHSATDTSASCSLTKRKLNFHDILEDNKKICTNEIKCLSDNKVKDTQSKIFPEEVKDILIIPDPEDIQLVPHTEEIGDIQLIPDPQDIQVIPDPEEIKDAQQIHGPKEIIIIDSDSNDSLHPCNKINMNSPNQNDIKNLTLRTPASDSPCHPVQEESYGSTVHFNFDMDNFNNTEIDIEIKGKNVNNKVKCTLRSTPQNSPLKVEHEKLLSPSNQNLNKNRSSLDKYLHTSFPSFSLEDTLPCVDNSSPEPLKQSTPKPMPSKVEFEKVALTPNQEDIIIKEATPNTSYSDMATPELKNELSKYGLKQTLGRKKANALLKYIREQIQVPDIPANMGSSTSKESRKSPPPKKRSSSRLKNISDEECSNVNEEREVMSQVRSTDTNLSDLSTCILNFLKTPELFSSIILFKPIALNTFYTTIKQHGIKCSLQELMDVLDNAGVFYRNENSSKSRQRKTKRSSKYKRK